MSVKSVAFTALFSGLLFVHAAPAMTQSKEELAEFDRLVTQGRDAYDSGEYARAVEAFRGAEAIYAHPKLAGLIVESYIHLGHCARAQKRLSKLRTSPESLEELPELERAIGQCRSMGDLEVSCHPRTLELKLDDRSIACGESWRLEAGEYRLIASAPGYESAEVEVVIEEAQLTQLPVELRPVEVFSDRETPILPIVGWSALGSGAALIGAALWVDSGSAARQEQMREASGTKDFARVQELIDEADSRRTLTTGLLVSGAVLAAGGFGVLVYDNFVRDEPTSKPLAVEVGVHIDRVSVLLAW